MKTRGPPQHSNTGNDRDRGGGEKGDAGGGGRKRGTRGGVTNTREGKPRWR